MTPLLCKKLTKSFHLLRFQNEAPYSASWALQPRISEMELQKILSQEFHFYSRGTQSFVFLSADGSFVLKLFVVNRCSSQLTRKAKKNLLNPISSFRVLEGCKTAYSRAPNETGLIYTHLNLTEKELPKIVLKGPCWKRTKISLDHYRFALQRRATSLSEKISKDYRMDDFPSFCEKINQVFSYLSHRTNLEIYNRDSQALSNYGFLENNEVMEMDFGQYSHCPEKDKEQKEKRRLIRNLKKWAIQKAPKWKEKIDSLFSTS